MSARGKLERKRFPYHKQMRYSVLFLVHAGSHLATDIRSERQDSHRFWNSGRSYRATCHAIVFQKETEDGTLQ